MHSKQKMIMWIAENLAEILASPTPSPLPIPPGATADLLAPGRIALLQKIRAVKDRAEAIKSDLLSSPPKTIRDLREILTSSNTLLLALQRENRAEGELKPQAIFEAWAKTSSQEEVWNRILQTPARVWRRRIAVESGAWEVSSFSKRTGWRWNHGSSYSPVFSLFLTLSVPPVAYGKYSLPSEGIPVGPDRARRHGVGCQLSKYSFPSPPQIPPLCPLPPPTPSPNPKPEPQPEPQPESKP